MEESQLHIVDLKSKDMLRKIENGIVYGLPVLLQDVLEELDPALEPVLAKALIKVGNREVPWKSCWLFFCISRSSK